jgi:hypothetical protein
MKLDDIILNSGGKFVTVTFIKKDGSERVLNGRMGVTKALALPVGEGDNKLDKDTFITIYDMKAQGYRAINRSTIISVTIDKETFV